MSLLSWWRELRHNRQCNSEAEWLAYAPVLGTPQRIAAWIDNNIDYDDAELPLRWRTVQDTLSKTDTQGFRYGNCSEAACLALVALRCLPGYKAEIACIDGEDKDRKKVGHAITCFSRPGVRGYINWEYCVEMADFTPWAALILTASPVNEWLATVTGWCDQQGNRIPVVTL